MVQSYVSLKTKDEMSKYHVRTFLQNASYPMRALFSTIYSKSLGLCVAFLQNASYPMRALFSKAWDYELQTNNYITRQNPTIRKSNQHKILFCASPSVFILARNDDVPVNQILQSLQWYDILYAGNCQWNWLWVCAYVVAFCFMVDIVSEALCVSTCTNKLIEFR